MKTLLTALLLFVSFGIIAQTKTQLPRSEFIHSLSESTLNVKPGEQKQVTVSILRSKSYLKATAVLGFSTTIPHGITVAYEPAEGSFETSIATITIDAGVAPGTYQLVLNASINHKIKGSILKLLVGDDNLAAK
jgi:hypothetical protein